MGVRVSLCVMLLGLSFSAVAQQQLPEKYFSVLGSFVDPDSERGTDEAGVGFDLIFGRELKSWLFWELRGTGEVHETSSSATGDNYRGAASSDLQVLLGSRGSFAAFAVAGLGWGFNDVPGSDRDDNGVFGSVGVGVLSRSLTSANIRFRLETRARYEDFIGGVTDFRTGLGIEIPIDPTEVVIQEVPVPTAASTAEAPPPVRANYPPRPVDMDRDGVLDNFDGCPGTVSGALVDASGCQVAAQAEDLSLRGVSFYPNSQELTTTAQTALDEVAQALRELDGRDVLVAGHTDSQGPENDNLVLSLARANSVKRYLTQRGVAAKRLKVVGYGESQPIASNATSAGRARNRRVELKLDAQLDPK
jgi:OOP family OmpA-OmpF porin